MIRTQISLTEEQMAKLRHLSRQRGVSIAAILREAVDQIQGDDRASRMARAVRAVGIGSSGRPDGSADHDRHLAAAFRG